jgi:hypothetical protein
MSSPGRELKHFFESGMEYPSNSTTTVTWIAQSAANTTRGVGLQNDL